MNGLTRRAGSLYGRSEDALGRSWPVWALALFLYAASALVILTRVRLPTPLHLLVFIMAAVVLLLTVVRIEWAIMGLALMIPFARPGFSLGPAKIFHVSGFNVAVFGVWVVHLFRYLVDRASPERGPLVRRTPLDALIAAYVFMITLSTLVALNAMADPIGRAQILLYYKEQIFYFAWFYLAFTLLRTPGDLRRFAMFLASSGLLVAALGLYSRVQGVGESAGVSEAEMEFGVVGGQTAGGWLGLVHPNFFGAFLIVSTPIWFFAVDHLRRTVHKLMVDLAILLGFVGLLFTYSRSAWGGMALGLGTQALLHRRTLKRVVLFIVLFAVVAQLVAVGLTGRGAVDLVKLRFEQLERSRFSSRPMIFANAMEVMRLRPLLGVGAGAFAWHASASWSEGGLLHAHNVVLTYACEFGLPAAALFVALLVSFIWMGATNLRRLMNTPGYGFLAQGTFAGMLAIIGQFMVEHILYSRDVGYAFYGVAAVILGLNRFLATGELPPPSPAPGSPPRPRSRFWAEA